MGGRRWWAVPGVAGVAVVAAGVIGPLPTAAAQDESTRIDARLGYLCAFPSGEQRVEVHLSADLPASATVEQPVRPSNLAIAVTVPPAGVTDLTATGAASVTAVARIGVTITHGGSSADTHWSGTETSRVPLPAEGDLELPLEPARVVPALLGTPGEMVFTATDTSLSLTGYLPDGAVTDPPDLELSCALDPDQNPALATVRISEADGPIIGEPPPGAVRVDKPPASAPAPDAQADPILIPEDCEEIDPPPGKRPTPARYCANVTAYTNLAKLDASVLQPVSLVNIGPSAFAQNVNPNQPPGWGGCRPDAPPTAAINCQSANILPNLDGQPVLRPAENQWVLPFGFVPTKASMQLTQIGLSTADIAAHAAVPPIYSRASVTARYAVRIYDASVNGVPFDLGPRCGTVRPLEITVRGMPGPLPGQYLLDRGGLLSGEVEIPPFTGCGVVEDVSPLLTGLISGPGNLVKLTQGEVCTMTGTVNRGCPPEEPEPQR